jgi:hypothetical protein
MLSSNSFIMSQGPSPTPTNTIDSGNSLHTKTKTETMSNIHDTGGQVNSVINNKASQYEHIKSSITRAVMKDEPGPDNGINSFLLLGTQLP